MSSSFAFKKTLKSAAVKPTQLSALDQILFGRELAAQSPSHAIAKVDYLKRVGTVQQYGRSTKKHQLFSSSSSQTKRSSLQKLNLLHNPVDMNDLSQKLNELDLKQQLSSSQSSSSISSSNVQVTTDSFATVHSVRIEIDESAESIQSKSQEYKSALARQLGQQVVDAYESAQKKLFAYKKDQWIKEMMVKDQENQHVTLSRLLEDDPVEQRMRQFTATALDVNHVNETPVVEKVLKQLQDVNMRERELLKASRRKWLDETEEEAEAALNATAAAATESELELQQQLEKLSDVEEGLEQLSGSQLEHMLRFMLPPLPYDYVLVQEMERAEKAYDAEHGAGSYRAMAADKQRYYEVMDKTTMSQILADIGGSASLATELSSGSAEAEAAETTEEAEEGEEGQATEESTTEEEKNE